MDAESWCLHEINPFPTPENLWKEMVGLADRDVGGIVTVSVLSDQRYAMRAQSHKPMIPISSTYFKSVTRQVRNTSRSWLPL